MKYRLILTLTVALSIAAICNTASADEAFEPAVIPRLQQWHSVAGSWLLKHGARIIATSKAFDTTAGLLAREMSAASGIPVAAVTGAAPRPGDIVLRHGEDASLGPEGYALTIGATVVISAETDAGVFHGTRTVLQMLRADPLRRHLHAGSARDWPIYAYRAEMLDVGRKFFPLDYLRLQIRRAAWYKLNYYQLHLSDWRAFRIESKRFPGLAAKRHYTQAQIVDLVAYAKQYHVTIVPEIDVPAHSVAFSRYRPSLALHCESMSRPHPVPWEGAGVGGWTLDVTKPATREFVEQLLDEMIPLFDGPYFHVGGDEIPDDAAKAKCPELVDYAKQHGLRYPNDAFVEFSNWLDAVVKRHGKTMQMWQWWDFNQQHSLDPAKDIVVVQWLGTPMDRAASGYKVIGSQDAVFYECPGLGTTHPGDYCFADPRAIYAYPYGRAANLLGYMYSRWNDRAEDMAIPFLDHRALAARVAFADRVWGGPRYADEAQLAGEADRIGDVDAAPGRPHSEVAGSSGRGQSRARSDPRARPL